MSDEGLDMLNSDDAAPFQGQAIPPERGVPQQTAALPDPEPSGDAMSKALVYLPESVQLRVATIAARFGIDPKADPIYAVVESVDLGAKCATAATAAAVAAGNAAQAVHDGVASIPDQIFDGAVRAGDEIKSNLIHGIRAQGVEVGQALRLTIADAANKGAVSLKTAASDLDLKLGKIPLEVQTQIDAYKTKGAAEFAEMAKSAALQVVQANLWAQMSRSALISVMAFCFACGVGAGGLWGYLKITHQIMPPGVTAQADPLMRGTLVSIPGGGEPVKCPAALCILYPN